MVRKWFIVVVFGVGMAGCARTGLVEPTSIPSTATPTSVIPTETLQPKATATLELPMATPTTISQDVDPVCLPGQSPDEFMAGNYPDMPDKILNYLNQGATAIDVDRVLYDAGIANQPSAVAVTDFTGDGKDDFAISIFNPESVYIPPFGRLLIYVCEAGRYELSFDLQPEGDFGGGPHLWYWRDMDGDKVSELVLSWAMCGAHTCYEQFEILGWNGSSFINKMEGTGEQYPYPDAAVNGPDDNGYYDLSITGSGIGSVGAGPQRSQTGVWKYSNTEKLWLLASESLGPSDYRIHYLHDADEAAKQKNFQKAIGLYNQVVYDPNLLDWNVQEEERANLGAFAQFRLVSLHLVMGDEDLAKTVLDQMKLDYPNDTPQHEGYVKMAELYYQTYLQAGEVTACQVVKVFANENSVSVLEPLGFLYFGYGNPEYKAETMCPGNSPLSQE